MDEGRNLGKSLSNDYRQFHDAMKERGLNSLERGIVYTGLAVGLIAPVAFTRYQIFPRAETTAGDIGYWFTALVMNTIPSALFKGFPLQYAAFAGSFAGVGGALVSKAVRDKLRERRNARRSVKSGELENKD